MSEEKIIKAKQTDVMEAQNKLCLWAVWMPSSFKCSCGHDFLDDPRALTECITGCPKCGRSYVD
tara:strand:+ start:125 stop:316 length:192 start_codon:yes stop_codon:yes gene_type:complete